MFWSFPAPSWTASVGSRVSRPRPTDTSGALLVPELMEYRPRSEVEDDPGFKQIIPYVVFRWPTPSSATRAANRRARPRLHRLRSLGVGGHVSEDDAQGGKSLDAYEAAIKRELDEEVEVDEPGPDAGSA